MNRDHAQIEYKNYNTFRVFDHYYNDRQDKDYDELIMPAPPKSRHFGLKLIIFLIVLVMVGLGLPPVLSYALKTPYPIIVINEDSMNPTLSENDLILVKGLISQSQIKPNDIIIYNNYTDNSLINSLSVKRVAAAEQDYLTIKGDDNSTPVEKIIYAQVIGRAVGNNNPVKIKWIGTLAKMINFK